MKKYKVYGTYTITISKEVFANNKEEAVAKAEDTFNGIFQYCGNDGDDKLIGVECGDEAVFADGEPVWGILVDEIGEDNNYRECLECDSKLKTIEAGLWYCDECKIWYDDNFNEIERKDLGDFLLKLRGKR